MVGKVNWADYRNVAIAMHEPDEFAIDCRYKAVDGRVSNRKFSPIRYTGKRDEKLLAFCLTDGVPKLFYVNGVTQTEIVSAAEILIPEVKTYEVEEA